MSPYLFLLCIEGLIPLPSRVVEERHVISIEICRGAPSITYILFVDDSILYHKANMAENKEILDLLDVYEQSSGQQINKDKTSMSYSKNVKPNIRRMIKALWGVEGALEHTRYLGLWHVVGQAKSKAFLEIKKTWQKLQG